MIDKSAAVFTRFTVVLFACAIVGACQDSGNGATQDASRDTSEAVAATAKPKPSAGDAMDRSPGKPTAPVSIRYSVVGNAVVGQPVAINLQVSSTVPGQAVTLHYRTNDSSAMLFPDSQAQRIEMNAAPDDTPRMQQVSVVPQREGRLFLNVSAEVQTDDGAMFRSIAIPIQVGSGSRAPAVNGEIRDTADGETIVSMPASENGES